MTKEEFYQIESSQKQHNEMMLHQDRQFIVVQAAEYSLFVLIKPKLYKDGNQWCCLYGENQMEGIVGFGNSPYLAILDWSSKWGDDLTKSSQK